MQHHTILTSSNCRSFPKKSKKGINFLTISLILIVSTFILQLGLWLSSSNFARHSSIDQISSLHQSTYKQQSVYTQRFTLTMKTSIQQRYISSKNVLPKSNISWKSKLHERRTLLHRTSTRYNRFHHCWTLKQRDERSHINFVLRSCRGKVFSCCLRHRE